jgi:hypothetical protein
MRRHPLLVLAFLLSIGAWAWQAQTAVPAPLAAPPAAGPAPATAAPVPPTTSLKAPPSHNTAAASAAAGATSATGTAAPQPHAPAGRATRLSALGLFGYWIGVVVLAVVLVWLASTTSLLRDRGKDTPWSLGRTQMAWWFFIVVASFVFIWLASGNYASLSNSVLALIGISSGTALSGAVIDDGKQSQMQQRPVLQAEQARLQQANQDLAAAAAAPPPGGQPAAALANVPALQANLSSLTAIAAQLAQIPTQQEPKNSFWRDILSDENGITFHRFQIVIWTLVLAVIFVSKVRTDRTMPDFSNQLLGLMGISSGTYVGFKFPEKQA